MQDINPCFATSCVFMMLNYDILTFLITISTKPVELLARYNKESVVANALFFIGSGLSELSRTCMLRHFSSASLRFGNRLKSSALL